jgi:glutaredoxin
MKAKTREGATLDLELYKFDSCPYCVKVMRVVDALKVPVTMRDIMEDASAARKLVEVGGDDQVPCLFIDGKPLYESDDIVDFLNEKFGGASRK